MKILFDTQGYVKTLKAGGVPENQANAMADGLVVAFNQGVATHEDIIELNVRIDGVDTKIDGVRTDLTAKIDGVETRMNAKIDGVRTDLTAKIDMLSTKTRMQFYLLAALIALTSHLGFHLLKVMDLLR
ncbi:MAG: hypothetical protein ACYDHY_15225 [Acidiferrobacterales bacterium]